MQGIIRLLYVFLMKDRKVDIMAIVLTNGTFYIWYTDTGATKKTTDIDNAFQFQSVTKAIQGMKKAKGKTKNYYVFDTLNQRILWKWMTPDEIAEVKRQQKPLSMIKRDKNGKIVREHYSGDTRKLIYLNAHGRCELCGREILFDDMTIDHVNPLSMGGEDDVSNLAAACIQCNQFKGNILPEKFMERISLIYLYQMEKKHKGELGWEIVHMMLKKML